MKYEVVNENLQGIINKKDKYLACEGCGFVDDEFDTGKGDKPFGCSKGCNRTFTHNMDGGYKND